MYVTLLYLIRGTLLEADIQPVFAVRLPYTNR